MFSKELKTGISTEQLYLLVLKNCAMTQNGNKRYKHGDETQQNYKSRCLHRWFETAVKIPDIQEPVKIYKSIFLLAIEYNTMSSMLSFCIQNQCQQILFLRSILLYYGSTKRVELFKDVLRMVPGYEFQYERKIIYDPEQSYNLVFLSELPNSEYRLREITSIKFLKPRVMRGLPLALKKFPPFVIPDYVKEVHSNGYLASPHYSRNASLWFDRLQKYLKQGLDSSNYLEYLRMLNQMDYHISYLVMCSYTIENAHLVPSDLPKQYLLSTDQFPVPPVLLEVGSFVHIMSTSSNRNGDNRPVLIRGFIAEWKTYMLIETESVLLLGQRKQKLVFPLNTTQFQMECHALSCMNRIDFASITFPSTTNQTVKKKGALISKKHTKFEWFQEEISGNELQQQAIANIINRTAYPAPYILFGPPGTGKTYTIVEAVLQIYKLQPQSRIIVTASSNYACNELTKRLLKFVPVSDIYRYLSFSTERDINLSDLAVLEISNMHHGMYETPSMEDFVNTRILVCTIMTSARLIQLSVRTSMYDYIFIDECGSSKELSSLVPIACIGTDADIRNKKLCASVILAGDPKQLGPVTRHVELQDTAHSISLLERLMELPYYKKDLNNNGYNKQVVTKLLDNYRSHRSLFEFSNNEFYEGELRAKASPSSTAWAIGWKCLPNPKFPMIFHSVFGVMIQDACSLSYLNCEEAKMVYQYVQMLLNESINGRFVREEDIGIVTPYARQVEYIKTGLSNLGLNKIEVGSAEQYQGREKPVIIVSTVRSNRPTVGFLSNQRRLNVVMTRAKALMIIIGNPNNLKHNITWNRLLRFLSYNKAIIGRNFEIESCPLPAPQSVSTFMMGVEDFS